MYVCMILLKNDFFWISQGKVATVYRWGEDLTYRKSLKWFNFWQSYLKNKKVDVFWGHSVEADWKWIFRFWPKNKNGQKQNLIFCWNQNKNEKDYLFLQKMKNITKHGKKISYSLPVLDTHYRHQLQWFMMPQTVTRKKFAPYLCEISGARIGKCGFQVLACYTKFWLACHQLCLCIRIRLSDTNSHMIHKDNSYQVYCIAV